jgi:hypothetical protein
VERQLSVASPCDSLFSLKGRLWAEWLRCHRFIRENVVGHVRDASAGGKKFASFAFVHDPRLDEPEMRHDASGRTQGRFGTRQPIVLATLELLKYINF